MGWECGCRVFRLILFSKVLFTIVTIPQSLPDTSPAQGVVSTVSPDKVGNLGFPRPRLGVGVGAVLWGAWLISRVLLLRLTSMNEWTTGDVHYYFLGVSGLAPEAMREYPAVGVWPAHLVYFFTNGSIEQYLPQFIGACLLIDAVFFAVVLRGVSASSCCTIVSAALMWIVFAPATGATFVHRLDLYPAVIVALAGLALFTRPAVSGALLALATMIKLWPVALAAGLVSGWKNRSTYVSLGWFSFSLVVLGALVSVTGGFSRLTSPLEYQEERGLQIESIAATPFMFAASKDHSGSYAVWYAPSKSFEITGPGVDIGLQLSTIVMVCTILAGIAWALVMAWKNAWTPHAALSFFIAMIFLLITANKVFSPQYIVWLGPILAVALLLHPVRYVYVLAAGVCAVAVMGQVIYPFHYDEMLTVPFAANTGITMLVLRNLSILVLTIIACSFAFSELRRAVAQRS